MKNAPIRENQSNALKAENSRKNYFLTQKKSMKKIVP